MSRKPPVPPIVVEVPVDEIQEAQRLLRSAGDAARVQTLVDAHIRVRELLTRMLTRPRRMPAGGGI